MDLTTLSLTLLAFTAVAASATEFHVAITGSDASPGTQAAPLRTIQRAADLAQPGDTVTVHAGVYRERVNPPRGGESDTKRIVYSTCSGISLGKDGDAQDRNSGSTTGYVGTIERGLKNGWNKETVGHHVVRNNHIAHCEQTGIVGSLGAAFSTVSGNSIHDIHVRQLFSGAEMAGIKFHGPIDAIISGNHIYRTCRGIWLDWMTQGARISGNLCHDNAIHDLAVEANHGPFEAPGTGTLTMKVWPLASTSGCAGAPNFWDDIPLSPSTRMPSVVLDDYWNSEFQRVNREVAAAQNTRLVFFGDSITWCWSLGDLTGQAVWNENYSQYNPINMGNSGDITPVMLYRVNHGNLEFAGGRHPKVAVLLCGINNLGVSQSAGGREQWHLGSHCPPADIANGIRAIAQVFRRRLPETRLIMMATLPVSDEGNRAKCRQASAINAAMVRNDNEVAFVDLQDKFMLPDGSFNKQLFTDGTHLTPEGYRVWAKGIEPLLLKFMKAPPLNPVKIMLIGDSMTEGADSNSSYRRYLDGMLRKHGHLIDFVGSRRKHSDDKTEPDNYEYDVDHEGHWGKSSAWLAENMQSLLASHVPDVAVINLGTEDIMSSKLAAESLTDGIVKNIGKVVHTLHAGNGKMKIVLSTVIPVAGKQDVVNLVNLKISRYVQSNSTRPCPVVLADPCKGFDVSRDLTADGAHPNAAGARKMARVFADVIHNTDLKGQTEKAEVTH